MMLVPSKALVSPVLQTFAAKMAVLASSSQSAVGAEVDQEEGSQRERDEKRARPGLLDRGDHRGLHRCVFKSRKHGRRMRNTWTGVDSAW